MDILEYIQDRIVQLEYLDKEYMKLSQDSTKSFPERIAARDAANEIFSRRQELDCVLRMFPADRMILKVITSPMLN